jgi:hypothetical protein
VSTVSHEYTFSLFSGKYFRYSLTSFCFAIAITFSHAPVLVYSDASVFAFLIFVVKSSIPSTILLFSFFASDCDIFCGVVGFGVVLACSRILRSWVSVFSILSLYITNSQSCSNQSYQSFFS